MILLKKLSLFLIIFVWFSFAKGKSKEVIELNSKYSKEICALKSGDNKEKVIAILGQPKQKNDIKNQSIWVWDKAKVGASATFTNNLVGSVEARANTGRAIDAYSSDRLKGWKKNKTKLAEVEKKMGKGFLVSVMFTAGRTTTLDYAYKSEISKKLLIDHCVKYYAFPSKKGNSLILLGF